ncbi:MAG: DUF262 domain-containing protein [Fimbriimonas sp.]
MDGSILEQYRVSDLLEWSEQKKLVINTRYQRGEVWSPTAKVFFIDTILRRMPVPKMYFRTLVDLQAKRSVREVVDGQQRLKALVEFSKGQFKLTKRAKEFAGLSYDDLDEELKERFLTYPIGVAQLINASEDDVLEVFSRINSYTVSLNDAEQRHAKFQGDFKWSVRDEAREATPLWEALGTFSPKDRIRMQDDSFMAEMYGIVLAGVQDGGQANITNLYRKFDLQSFTGVAPAQEQVRILWRYILTNLAPGIQNTALSNAPHFLMLFAAVAHAKVGIPIGELDDLPVRDGTELTDIEQVLANLSVLGRVLEADEAPTGTYKEFWNTSNRTTQRIASRKVRFRYYYNALKPSPLPAE